MGEKWNRFKEGVKAVGKGIGKAYNATNKVATEMKPGVDDANEITSHLWGTGPGMIENPLLPPQRGRAVEPRRYPPRQQRAPKQYVKKGKAVFRDREYYSPDVSKPMNDFSNLEYRSVGVDRRYAFHPGLLSVRSKKRRR